MSSADGKDRRFSRRSVVRSLSLAALGVAVAPFVAACSSQPAPAAKPAEPAEACGEQAGRDQTRRAGSGRPAHSGGCGCGPSAAGGEIHRRIAATCPHRERSGHPRGPVARVGAEDRHQDQDRKLPVGRVLHEAPDTHGRG